MEKVTKRDNYNDIRDILVALGNRPDLIEFVDHELDLLAKKNARRSEKPTAKQAENAVMCEAIYEAMESGKQYTVTELQGLIPSLAEAKIQKVSSLVTRLRNEGYLTREIIKGRAYFTKI